MPLSPICWPPGRQRRYWVTIVCASVVFAQTYATLMCSLGGKVGFGFRECARGSWHRRGWLSRGSTQRWRVFVGFGMRFGEMERGSTGSMLGLGSNIKKNSVGSGGLALETAAPLRQCGVKTSSELF